MKQCPQNEFPNNGKTEGDFPNPYLEPSDSAASGTRDCMQGITACGIETITYVLRWLTVVAVMYTYDLTW